MKEKKFRCLVFSDAHCHNYTEYSFWLPDGITSRMKHIYEAIEKVYTYAINNNIRNVLFTGDMFHQRGNISVPVFNKIFGLISKYSDLGILTVMIAGNHDYATKAENEHSLNAFSQIENVIVLKKLKGIKINGMRIIGIPAMENKEILFKKITKSVSNVPTILMLHTQVSGSVTSTGYAFKDGYDIEKHGKKFAAVFIGDIHKYQVMSDNVIIPGSLIQHNFSDSKSKKFFLDVKFSNGKMIACKKIDTDMPMFYEIVIDSPEYEKLQENKTDYYRFISKKDMSKNQVDRIRGLWPNSNIVYDIKYQVTGNIPFSSGSKKDIVKTYLYDVLDVDIDKKRLNKIAGKFI